MDTPTEALKLTQLHTSIGLGMGFSGFRVRSEKTRNLGYRWDRDLLVKKK